MHDAHAAQPGAGVRPTAGTAARADESFYDRFHLAIATALTLLFLVAAWGLGAGGGDSRWQLGLFLLAYLTGGTYATRDALHALFVERTIDVDLLMVCVALGAAAIGHWTEGATLLFLFSLGNTLEHFAMARTHRAVRALMALHPEEATVIGPAGLAVVPIGEVATDALVLVKPGERIPTDGIVTDGTSAVDQAPITGESIPVEKAAGDEVFAGTINGRGALRVRVTRLAQESTLAKIIAIVERAQADKSRAQRFTDRFEGWYAGLIIAFACLVWLVPILVAGESVGAAFYRAMVVLVVASPCALVISTPAATLSALANAARSGILFKGAAHLENAGAIKAIAFDKTGTLTAGKPQVTDLLALDAGREDDFLATVAAVERLSEHPLALAIVEAAQRRQLTVADAEAVTAITGQGVRANVAGQHLLVGNERLFADQIAIPDALSAAATRWRGDGKTVMFVGEATTGRMLGGIAVADVVRPDSKEAVAMLRRQGVERLIMLTGDNELAAQTIARAAGIDEVYAGLLPEEKLAVIETLKARHGSVAMVGDGVNDAPALAAATIGIAMGGAGSDAALETADVVLMADDLRKLPYAMALGGQARRVIRQNLVFALGVIVILVGFALAGEIPLPVGVVGHEGSTIIVVLNGLRLLAWPRLFVGGSGAPVSLRQWRGRMAATN